MINANKRGVFITFEGGEGVGKSTQVLLLALRLRAAGIEVELLREPGGTHVSESIRSILLDPGNSDLDPTSELLLYEAARAQLVANVIEPALAAGKTVICDRFTDSTLAYQGYGRSLDIQAVKRANQIGSKGLAPHRTILLKHDTADALDRATANGADRLELEGLDFHHRVAQGFDALALQDPERVRTVLSCPNKADTAQAVFNEVADLFCEAQGSTFVIDEELLAKVKKDHD